ncbi:similar to Saccharomyces cerevisiae YNL082W PMS1 ATP-binding protein required for mismatch repair in mitosis and meiosis [Maudiozyma saulgeensis]|uniref:Similar to Saccharomyces cerevisiae YNL082W PMS1 ATP-binding protein required for mismatch repair in mitosis and meiosis n=1 Tax=Maudiozyma saulgeensis TaxID=1789683 RepID=A0A1X7QZL8_9SACH|nr:similar to Saccharomyces cerevisiae YNL082W PMS1 ATP-binding protein required for mismatch repair in mitosis and meiosis [Kazachstania saulgeensis]
MATDTIIKAIAISDINRITSGQVIVDLISAVKELIDNSIDSGADQIDITFQNYGIDSIECSDNGSGISEANFQTLTLKHYTSKLTNFNDIMNISSLGFRGEALFSLCNISKLSITTTEKGPKANKIEYDRNGKIISNNITSRNKGTTVEIKDMFKNLPVRRKEFIRTTKNQFAKCITLLQSYAIINEKVKFTIVNINSNGRKNVILRTNKNENMSKKILNIFGSSCLRGLIPLNISLDLDNVKEEIQRRESKINLLMSGSDLQLKQNDLDDINYKIKLSGFISKSSVGIGHNSRDRQFIYINRRPVSYPVLNKCFNETFRSFNNETNVKYPIFFVNFEINSNLIDINVTPDKRTVLLHNEDIIIDSLRENLVSFFESQDVSIVKSTTLEKRKRTDEYQDDSDSEIKTEELSMVQDQNCKRLKREQCNIKTYSDKTDFSDISIDGNMNNNDTELSSIMDMHKEDFLSRDFPSSQGEENRVPNSEPSFNKEPELFEGKDEDEEEEEEEGEEGYTSDRNEGYGILSDENLSNKNSTNVSGSKVNISDFKNPEYESDDNSSQNNFSEIEEGSNNDVVVVQVGDDIIHSQVKVTPNKGLVFLDEHEKMSANKKNDTLLNDNDNGHLDDQNNSSSTEENSYDLVEITKPMETNIRTPVMKFADDVYSNRLKLRAICEERERIFKKKFEIYELDMSLDIDPNNMSQEYTDVVNTIREWEKPNKEDNHENVVTDEEMIGDDIQEIARKLTLTINKTDFNDMSIVGQFNLGFIITTKKNKQNKKMDLFIIDQHASDEKYNFEMLQRDTMFKSQRLIAPEKLELNIIDELTTLDNIEILEKNGFKLQIEEDAEPGSRIQLISKPTSKNTTFGVDDLYELISMIREHNGIRKDYIRCSKIRSMFAMRACRMSIMVGKPLNRKTMKKVVGNLSTLDKPWNCPHGRPTMKHLLELNEWNSFTDDYNI